MIGLVNATGVTDALHREVFKRSIDGAEKTTRIPLLTNELAANRVLTSAVESILLQNDGAQRGVPDDAESDRFRQADLEAAGNGGALGMVLDVTG